MAQAIKILLVDDSNTVRLKFRQSLCEEKFEVIEGVDGINGLELVRENADISVLFTDLNMPRLDGLSLVKKIRAENLIPNVPILMLTTETSKEYKQAGKELGVLAWVAKPFDTEKLEELIEMVVKKSKS